MTGNKKITCVGSGVIGTAWSVNFAWKGMPVCIYDLKEEYIEKAKASILAILDSLQEYHLLEENPQEIFARITFTTDLEAALKDTCFVQECGPENLTIKKDILAKIEKYIDSETVIASSTSGLLISEITEDMRFPERVVGGHPYNPVYLIPLVEIVKGEMSSQEAAMFAHQIYSSIGKEPVILNKEVSGFISNRLQVALYREAVDLVVNGVCSIEDLDKACLYGPGIRWGIMGPNMIFYLGSGADGLSAFLEKQKESVDYRLSTMATWTELPQDFISQADAGMEEALAHRETDHGKTPAELILYRDKMLIEILKLHGKL